MKHFLKSYRHFIGDLLFDYCAPISLFLFLLPIFGHFLYFMTYYDPMEDL